MVSVTCYFDVLLSFNALTSENSILLPTRSLEESPSFLGRASPPLFESFKCAKFRSGGRLPALIIGYHLRNPAEKGRISKTALHSKMAKPVRQRNLEQHWPLQSPVLDVTKKMITMEVIYGLLNAWHTA